MQQIGMRNMKRNTTTRLTLCAATALVIASGAALANPTDFEIKGMRIGMSDAEFKKLNPKAACDPARTDKDRDSSSQTCSVRRFTLANKEALSATFGFFDGKLGSWSATFYDFYGKDIQQALADKFGPPRMDASTQGVIWKFGGTTMHLAPAGSSVLLLIQSDISIAHSLKLEEIKRRKAKADL